jgi:hypothetical protein
MKDGSWRVIFLSGRDLLFDIPFKKEKPACYMAAKFVDELLRNRREFTWSVQDEGGQVVQSKDLLQIAQRWKVRWS